MPHGVDFDHLGKVADDQRMNDDPVSGERERTPEEVKAFMVRVTFSKNSRYITIYSHNLSFGH